MNNSRILTIKNAKFSGYYFHMNLNIWGVFRFCISVTLTKLKKIKLFYLHSLLLHNIVEKWSWDNLKVIKNIFPDESGNPESPKKSLQQFKSFSTNVPIVGEGFQRTIYRLFYLRFLWFKWSVKKQCVGFTSNLRDIFTWK